MGEENKVILHGTWVSTFVKRVELGLKIKGIPYEFVEEDLSKKSELLLMHNPIYKKVPMLVHNGKPVCESLIILEYINETWNDEPSLFPNNPYERARVRFWANYINQLLYATVKIWNSSDAEEENKAFEEVWAMMKLLEEGIKDFSPNTGHILHGGNMDLLDIMLVSTFGAHKAQDEVLGVKIMDPEKTPLLHSWVTTLTELPVVKEVSPPHEKLVSFLKMLRQSGFKFPTN